MMLPYFADTAGSGVTWKPGLCAAESTKVRICPARWMIECDHGFNAPNDLHYAALRGTVDDTA
jgi:hypothetical protein